jgi:hypothetical protein
MLIGIVVKNASFSLILGLGSGVERCSTLESKQLINHQKDQYQVVVVDELNKEVKQEG